MMAGRAAETMLGAMFVHGGWCTLQDPEPRVRAAGPLLARLRRTAPFLPGDQVLVTVNAAVHVAAGASLATGVLRRPAAAALALSLIPTTVAGHAFWEASDPAVRERELIQFGKNLAVLGGLLLAAEYPGDPDRQ